MTDRIVEPGGPWIQTRSGRAFFPMDPHPDDIDIEDIAGALSKLCRFNGHSRRFYSVAEHSVLVSRIVEHAAARRRTSSQGTRAVRRRLALAGLLHDASEAYLVDLPRPVKKQAEMMAYRAAEAAVERAVVVRFGLESFHPWWPAVTEADEMALRTEVRDLVHPRHPAWLREHTPEGGETWPEPIAALAPDEAEALFLARFRDLTER